MPFERIHRGVFFSFFFIIVLVSHPVSAHNESISQICEQAITLDLGTTSRLNDWIPTEDNYFRIHIPEPGFVSLDVSATGDSSIDPILMPAQANCNGLRSPEPFVLERTLGSAVLGFAEAGDFLVRVASSGTSQALSNLKIQTGYASYGEDEIESEPNPFDDPNAPPPSVEEDEDEIESEPNPFANPVKFPNVGEDEDEIESEPNPFADPGTSTKTGEDEDEIESEPNPFANPVKFPNVGEDEDEIESEPNPFNDPNTPPSVAEDEDEIESEPNPFADPGSKLDPLSQLCSFGEADDHSDSFLCATAITAGGAVEGAIDNDWGDDSDIFKFVLDDPDLWRVTLSATGDIAVTAELVDHSGQRLDQNELNSADLTKVLPPGVYYLRITGTLGAEGSYRLNLETSLP